MLPFFEYNWLSRLINQNKGDNVVKWELSNLMGRCAALDGGRLTYGEIKDATGVASSTLSALAQGTATRIDIGTVDKLLEFFSVKLGSPLSTDDLIKYAGGTNHGSIENGISAQSSTGLAE